MHYRTKTGPKIFLKSKSQNGKKYFIATQIKIYLNHMVKIFMIKKYKINQNDSAKKRQPPKSVFPPKTKALLFF